MNRRDFLLASSTVSTAPFLPQRAKEMSARLDAATNLQLGATIPVLDTRVLTPTKSGDRVDLPAGTFYLPSTLEIGNGTYTAPSSIGSITIEGKGAGAGPGEILPSGAGTTLVWNGPWGEPMIRLNGPIAGCTIRGIHLVCGLGQGVYMDHAINSRVEDLQITNYTRYGLRMVGKPPIDGCAITGGHNDLERIAFTTQNPTANALWLGSTEPGAMGCSNVSVRHCGVLGGAGGFCFANTDYDVLEFCYAYFCSKPILIAPISVDPYRAVPGYPSGIYFDTFATDRIPRVEGFWNPAPNVGVSIKNWHREWNGGPAGQDTSYGPPLPKLPYFRVEDNLGNRWVG